MQIEGKEACGPNLSDRPAYTSLTDPSVFLYISPLCLDYLGGRALKYEALHLVSVQNLVNNSDMNERRRCVSSDRSRNT